MLKHISRMKRLPIKKAHRPASRSVVGNSPGDKPAGDAHAASNPAPAPLASKWQLALMGMSVILGIMLIVWFARAGISHPTNTPAIATDRNPIEKSPSWRGPHVIDADVRFEEQARATERGFISAFPFHR